MMMRVDQAGNHDVRARIARLDRLYPDAFALHPIRGYAEKTRRQEARRDRERTCLGRQDAADCDACAAR